MDNYDAYFKHAKLITELHAVPKELKPLDNYNKKNEMEEKPEMMKEQPAKKENENKKKWMKRI